MIEIIDGDIFNSDADVILHQVNCQGVMYSGVAKQVREKFPKVFDEYKQLCSRDKACRSSLLGLVQFVDVGDYFIANLFAQKEFGYDGNCYTDYFALRLCLKAVKAAFLGKKAAIPYLMGCHRGGGDWNVVSKMIEEVLGECDVIFYKYTAG